MIDLFSTLTKFDERGDVVFDDADIRAKATECINLVANGLLAVKVRDELFVSFAVFSFHTGPATSTSSGGAIVDGTKWEIVVHGEGPSGPLRELRHTYWGEVDAPGYIFYPNGALIADAFRHLQRWFDCGGETP